MNTVPGLLFSIANCSVFNPIFRTGECAYSIIPKQVAQDTRWLRRSLPLALDKIRHNPPTALHNTTAPAILLMNDPLSVL